MAPQAGSQSEVESGWRLKITTNQISTARMSSKQEAIEQALAKTNELRSSAVYGENLAFWQRAWNMVKTPYTQLPDLPYIPWIPARLEERAAKRILDLGCGSGWLSIFLARHHFQVTGVDISENAIRLAREWAASEGLNIHFDVGDIAALDYPDGSFDGVVANSIFEHFTLSLARVTLARLRKMLVPGGIFIGCFDMVGGGPGEYYELEDGTHIYTDKGRKGMLLRCFSDQELNELFSDWQILELTTLASGSRFLVAHT
ncbi:MAG TPA: class I SAM-dependent methyltransferase [Candidatus Obscuribacterales bacterium]